MYTLKLFEAHIVGLYNILKMNKMFFSKQVVSYKEKTFTEDCLNTLISMNNIIVDLIYYSLHYNCLAQFL